VESALAVFLETSELPRWFASLRWRVEKLRVRQPRLVVLAVELLIYVSDAIEDPLEEVVFAIVLVVRGYPQVVGIGRSTLVLSASGVFRRGNPRVQVRGVAPNEWETPVRSLGR
jgi:hypothetical protein